MISTLHRIVQGCGAVMLIAAVLGIINAVIFIKQNRPK